MTDKEQEALDLAKTAKNEARRIFNHDPTPINRAEFNTKAAYYQRLRIKLDPEYRASRAADSRRAYRNAKTTNEKP